MSKRFHLTAARLDRIIFSVLLSGYTLVMFALFYRQATGRCFSDMAAYILEIQGLDSGYSFPYPVFFTFGKFINWLLQEPELSIAIAAAFLNCLSPIFLRHYLDDYVQLTPLSPLAPRLLNTVAAFGLLFASVLLSPVSLSTFGIIDLGGGYYQYLGAFGQNPFHNATYIATRPFAIISFFLFARILANYEEKPYSPDYLWFSLSLLLTTLTKPSFTFIIVPTAGLILLYRLIHSKGKNWKATLLFAATAVPTFCVLLYQFSAVFEPVDTSGEHGIGFGVLEVWHIFSNHVLVAILLVTAFPIIVLILNFKELKSNTLLRTSWAIFLVSLVECAFLFEKGFRKSHGNFFWGYMHGQSILFIAAIALVLLQTLRVKQASKADKCKLAVEWFFFGWHTVSGLLIFVQYFLNHYFLQ